MFTILDFSKGYYLIELDEASSFLIIFNRQFGRFRFTGMPFGLTVVGDAFQHKIEAVFSSLDFCTGIADDVIIRGEQPDGSDSKHKQAPV